MTDETKQSLCPRESLSPKDYLSETCRCEGGLGKGCSACGGTGRAVRRTSPPTAEWLKSEPEQPYMKGCLGPLPWAEADEYHLRRKPFPEPTDG
jgi:hypothetical protein